MAVPDLLALSNDKETQEAARLVAEVLWDDLNYEREFYMIPRDTYKSIPAAGSIDTVPYDRWREIGADGVIIGTVQRAATGIRVEMRLYNVRARQSLYGREYTGAAANPRVYAHTMADDLHESQLKLRGVARTKLAFVSDRNREPVATTVEKRDVKEIYISDYDGANQRRITINRNLNINPNWSPDGRSIAYSSYRTGIPDILISNIFAGTMENPTKGMGQNFLPVFSPDGTRIAFMSMRDGNSEIYIMNRDGSDVRRVTNNPAIDGSPTWSPTGTQIAFTSERTGTPQIYTMNIDGSGLRSSIVRIIRRPGHLVACAVQRDRLHRPDRARLRHQDSEYRQRRDPPDHLRRRHQRKPRLGAEWAASGVHVHAQRPQPDFHRRSRRPEPAADHARRQQHHAALVTVIKGAKVPRFQVPRLGSQSGLQRLRSVMRRDANRLMVFAVLMTVVVGACGKKPAPVARPMPPPACQLPGAPTRLRRDRRRR